MTDKPKQSMSFDDLGDRMKLYENQEAGRMFMPAMPIIARLDGRAFHTFTRGLEQPYSEPLRNCMVETARALVKEFSPTIAYRQSDEITLVWKGYEYDTGFMFDGRVQKMVSLLAAACTVEFHKQVLKWLPVEYHDRPAMFDCRVWQVPNETEAANVLFWRETDAVKNSIMAGALAVAGHKATVGKSKSDQLDIMFNSGINWNEYPDWAKRGVYISRQTVTRAFTATELSELPPGHHAHRNPALTFERTVIEVRELPPLNRIANRPAVLFHGATPEAHVPNTPEEIEA